MSEDEASGRRPWVQGPDEDAPPETWLGLEDDGLLHRIQTLEKGTDEDDRLIVSAAQFGSQAAQGRIRL